MWQLSCATVFVLVAAAFGAGASCGLIYAVVGSVPLQPALPLGLTIFFLLSAAYYASTKELRYVRVSPLTCTLGFLIGTATRRSSELTAVFVGPPRQSLGSLRRLVLQFGTLQQKVFWLSEHTTTSFLHSLQELMGRSIIVRDPDCRPADAPTDPLLVKYLNCPLERAASLAEASALRRKFLASIAVAMFLAIPIPFGIYAVVTSQLGAMLLIRLLSSIASVVLATAAAFHFAVRARAARRRIPSQWQPSAG